MRSPCIKLLRMRSERSSLGRASSEWRSRPLSSTRGVATTLIAKEDLVYEKLYSPEVSDFFAEYFRARGVDFIFGEEVKEFWGTTKVEGIVTSSGKRMPCDIVAIGIGVRPEVGFLADSGIDVDGGILVDQYLETNRPGILRGGRCGEFL